MIYSIFGRLDLLIYKPLNVNKKIKIYPMWSECLINYKRKRKGIDKMLNFFTKKNLPKDSIVIDTFRLPENFIKKLKSNGNIVIFNHAGLLNAFIKYFGMNGKEQIMKWHYKSIKILLKDMIFIGFNLLLKLKN